jgi:hypothetical protein
MYGKKVAEELKSAAGRGFVRFVGFVGFVVSRFVCKARFVLSSSS